MEQEQDKGKRGCAFYGCITVIVLALGFAAVLAAVFLYGRAEYGPLIDRYNSKVNGEQYEEAYAATADAWKKAQTQEEFTRFEKTVHAKLGRLTDYTITGVNIQLGAQAVVTANATFENGDAVVTYTILKDAGQDRIAGVHYSSELLLGLLACPHCGKPLNSIVKFCPNCGQPVGE